jgi:acyl-CoA thioesterase-1
MAVIMIFMNKLRSLILITLFLQVCLSVFAQSEQDALKILFIGDSLTAGYGVDKEESYPSLFEQMASSKLGKPVKVMNGSVSASTSASGPSRLKWYLKSKPDWLILALGANDGLRGLKVESTKENLEKTILKAKSEGLKVVLTGMLMPKNYGEEYREKFSKIYSELAKKHDILLIPFLLEGVALKKDLNQPDGIHPNEKGHEVLANNLWEFMRPHLN